MTMETQPVEDVSAIQNGDFPLSSWFSGGVYDNPMTWSGFNHLNSFCQIPHEHDIQITIPQMLHVWYI